MDMCNGEILSFGIAKQPTAKNVMDALEQAIEKTSDCPYRRTFHSDQGWAYQMKSYSHRLKEERILKSEIERYIKYYNEQRIKEKQGWMSPVQYRLSLLAT